MVESHSTLHIRKINESMAEIVERAEVSMATTTMKFMWSIPKRYVSNQQSVLVG